MKKPFLSHAVDGTVGLVGSLAWRSEMAGSVVLAGVGIWLAVTGFAQKGSLRDKKARRIRGGIGLGLCAVALGLTVLAFMTYKRVVHTSAGIL